MHHKFGEPRPNAKCMDDQCIHVPAAIGGVSQHACDVHACIVDQSIGWIFWSNPLATSLTLTNAKAAIAANAKSCTANGLIHSPVDASSAESTAELVRSLPRVQRAHHRRLAARRPRAAAARPTRGRPAPVAPPTSGSASPARAETAPQRAPSPPSGPSHFVLLLREWTTANSFGLLG